jgi:hypothetical protein
MLITSASLSCSFGLSGFWLNETNQMNQINQIKKTNQINLMDQIDQMNKTGCRTFSASWLEAHQAALEELGSLESIAAALADSSMPEGIAGSGYSRT